MNIKVRLDSCGFICLTEKKSNIDFFSIYLKMLETTTTIATTTTTTTERPIAPPPPALFGPKNAKLIDYGRAMGSRAGPIGWILALISGLILLPLALAFAARHCARGGCGSFRRPEYVPVLTGTTGGTQTDIGRFLLKRIFFKQNVTIFVFVFSSSSTNRISNN